MLIKDLDSFMLKYNLLEYCNSYSITFESLYNYYRDKVNYSAEIR